MRKLTLFLLGSWRGLAKVQAIIIVVAGVSLGAATVFEVFCRAVVQTSVFGIDEIMLTIVWWFYAIGVAYGSLERSQIAANIAEAVLVSQKARPRFHILLGLSRSIINVIIGSIILWWAVVYIKFYLEIPSMETTIFLGLPTIIPKLGILIGFGLMLLYFITETVDYVYRLSGKRVAFLSEYCSKEKEEEVS